MFENRQLAVFEGKCRRIIDEFGRKRYQKKRKDVDYKVL